MSSGKAFGVLVTLVVAGLCINHFRYEIGDMMHQDRKVIVADIKLDNRCEFRDHVFIARDLNSGKYASFSGGRAKLRTRERNRVTIEFSPQYREVEFYARTVPVAKDMVMVANCRAPSLLDMKWFG